MDAYELQQRGKKIAKLKIKKALSTRRVDCSTMVMTEAWMVKRRFFQRPKSVTRFFRLTGLRLRRLFRRPLPRIAMTNFTHETYSIGGEKR